MPTNQFKPQFAQPDHTVIEWLLDSDPAIRWQVMHDVLAMPADAVAAERARVATEDAGTLLLARQDADGKWGGRAFNNDGNATMHVLMLLRDLGFDPASTHARHAMARVRDRVIWEGWNNPFWVGEGEPCINGQVAAVRTSARMLAASSPGCSVSN